MPVHFSEVASPCLNFLISPAYWTAGHFPPMMRPQRHSSQLPVHSTERNTHIFSKSGSSIVKRDAPLDLTQRLEKKLAEYNASDNVLKRWILELSSWAISALCLGAVVGIYLHINGQSMAQSEQLLTWTNAFGKIASAALIVPTSEALGQLKWNWFHRSRAMWDFEIFDKASRGPWGAVMLLFRTRGRSLAAMGALLIVLLLAIDTFLQQVVQYEDHWISKLDLKPLIPHIIEYKPLYSPEFQHHEEAANTDKAIVAVIREIFYGNGTQPVPFGNGTRPDIPLSCPTSKCRWDSYQTLAVCSRCEEITQDLDISYTCMYTAINWSANWTGPITEMHSSS